jgi:hypothetical protein
VRRVGLGRAHVVGDLGRLALHEVADGLRVEGLLGAVGRDTERLAQTVRLGARSEYGIGHGGY